MSRARYDLISLEALEMRLRMICDLHCPLIAHFIDWMIADGVGALCAVAAPPRRFIEVTGSIVPR